MYRYCVFILQRFLDQYKYWYSRLGVMSIQGSLKQIALSDKATIIVFNDLLLVLFNFIIMVWNSEIFYESIKKEIHNVN